MKKLVSLVCALALVLALFAMPAMAEGKPLKILILTSAGIDDGNFNQDCYVGIQAFLADHPDCTVADVKETDLAQIVPRLEQLVGDYDVFVLPGFYFGTIGDIVNANPEKIFLVVDSTVADSEGNPVTAPNVYTFTYKEQEAGFLAGAAAALSSSTGKAAIVNGIAFPSNVNYEYGFYAGINYSNAHYGTAVEYVELPSFAGTDLAGNNVGGNYTGDFNDTAIGKTIGQALIQEGCDVLFVAAGQAGFGVLSAAKEAENVWFIGCDVDQYDDGDTGNGNVVLTSALKVMHLDVQRQLTAIYDGTFEGQDALLGADTDSTGYVSEANRQQLTEDAIVKLDECLAKIKSGEIVPPSWSEHSVTDFPGL